MTSLSPAQRDLADVYGVGTEYVDWQGRATTVSSETLVAVLAAMDVDATAEAAEASLASARQQAAARPLPVCTVLRQSHTTRLTARLRHASPSRAWVTSEDGDVRQLRLVGTEVPPTATTEPAECTLLIPDGLPLGYHTLHLRDGDHEHTAPLIVTPERLQPDTTLGHRRQWGLGVQLYSVTSHASWGLGDLADLGALATWSATDHGAGYLLVNPLHAAAPTAPMEPSPYLPTSRRFVNPIYLRPEDVPEYAGLSPAERSAAQAQRDRLQAAAATAATIDRDASWAAKRTVLEQIHALDRTPQRDAAYRVFLSREGAGLRDFATWCAIAEQHGPDWTRWPADLRSPSSAGVERFRAAHGHRVDFHCWLQWLLHEQLSDAQDRATSAGMPLGIMQDLAVGVHPRGADAWAQQEVFAGGVTVGAPPDAFNQLGQDWNQPPWRPDRLAAAGYQPFRDLVAALLRHAGAVRVDHILGLFRLWWIPSGQSPAAGAYVSYDHDALLGILALEAHRSGAVVVGEDLGTVEPTVRRTLRDRGILGTSILWFERDADGAPQPPERWRRDCLASVATHDLPPTRGYLAGDHVRLRDRLGLLSRPVEQEAAADAAGRAAWLAALDDLGLLAPDPTAPDPTAVETVHALYRYLTRTPALLVNVLLVDAVGDRRTQNQPGTSDAYPNWRVPLCDADGRRMYVEDVRVSSTAAALLDIVRRGLHPTT